MSLDEPASRSIVRLGRYEVPEDWPVRGEAGRTFKEKLRNGFFSAYMAGEVTIDVGYRGGSDDAVPILPHAIGVDLDFPGYDGKTLPFADETIDTVHSSHMLEHVADYRGTIRDWHRVVRCGGFIVCAVPHQFLYEKKSTLPSQWNADHKRFYTPASLLREFEETLEPNTYRVRQLRDNDENYTYDIGPEAHSGGGYEIELVIQKIKRPDWDLLDRPDALDNPLCALRDEVSRLTAERDKFAGESARWFDAAILAPATEIAQGPRAGPRQGWRRRTRFMRTSGCRTRAASIDHADRARDAAQWERAARFYLDALAAAPDAAALWLNLGHALEASGKPFEAKFAYRQAAEVRRR
jgi:SAM-dependent methyltransferase